MCIKDGNKIKYMVSIITTPDYRIESTQYSPDAWTHVSYYTLSSVIVNGHIN